MILRQLKVGMEFFQIITLLFLWVIPVLQGHVVGEDWHSSVNTPAIKQLRITEQVVKMQGHQDSYRHMDVKRSSHECRQERLDSILSSCEAAVAATSGSAPTTLVFCGADCNHLVINYANECSNSEFLVNISGACKLSGSNLTVECVYAVILVKMGITSCIKMVADVDSTRHEIDGLAPTPPQFREYIDEQCCSLETSYESFVTHEVYADRMGRPVIEPPLVPPWLQTNSSDYQAVIDVATTELCLVPLPTELPTTEFEPSSVSQDEPSTSSSSNSSSDAASGASGVVTQRKSGLSLFVYFVLFSLSASSL